MFAQDIEVEVYRSRIKIPMIFLVPVLMLTNAYAMIYLYVNSSYFVESLTGAIAEAIPGTIDAEELIFRASLVDIEIRGAKLLSASGEEIVRSEKINASLNPLLLVLRRLHIRSLELTNTRFDMEFVEDGRLNLLAALGIEESSPDDEPAWIEGVSIGEIVTRDCAYTLDLGFLRLSIPTINFVDGEVHVEPDDKVMALDELILPELELEISPKLMGFYEDKGPWKLVSKRVAVEMWRWAGDGFTVGDLSVELGGARISTSGRLWLTETDPESPTVVSYDASFRAYLPYWTPAIQYFIEDRAHVHIDDLVGDAKGTLETVDGEAFFELALLEVEGLTIHDLSGKLTVDDSLLSIPRIDATLDGGPVHVRDAFFDIASRRFGGVMEFEGIDPDHVLRSFDMDSLDLGAKGRGEVQILGRVPGEGYFAGQPYRMLQDEIGPLVDIFATENIVFERQPSRALPVSKLSLDRGTHLWASHREIGVPSLQADVDDASLRVTGAVYNWQDAIVSEPMTVALRVPEIGDFLQGFPAAKGARGALNLEATMEGPLGSPKLTWTSTIQSPSVLFENRNFSFLTFDSAGTLDRGQLTLETFDLASDFGRLKIDGTLLLVENAGVAGQRSWSENPAVDLQFELDDLDLAAVEPLLDVGPIAGELSARGTSVGRLLQPQVSASVDVTEARVQGQNIDRVHAEFSADRARTKVENLFVDLGSAGRVRATGEMRSTGQLHIDLLAKGLVLEELSLLSDRMAVPVVGRGDLRLSAKGSLEEPTIVGDAQFQGLRVDERSLGDGWFVADTHDGVVRLAGAILPLVRFDVEWPLDGDSPYYVRAEARDLDVLAVAPELSNLGLDEVDASGIVEVFLDPAFDSYQVLSHLTELRTVAFGRTYRNSGPIAAGVNDGNLLQIQQAAFESGGEVLTVQGGVFLEESLVDLHLKGGVDLKVLNEIRSRHPAFFPDSFLEIDGKISMDLGLRGNGQNWIPNGSVTLSPTEIRMRDFPEPLVLATGKLLMSKGEVAIDPQRPLRGRAFSGAFSLTGSMELVEGVLGAFDASFWSHNMSYRVPGVASLSFDTDLNFQGSDLLQPETWLVKGDVDILDSLYYQDISIFQEQLASRIIGAFNRTTQEYEASLAERVPLLKDVRFDLGLRARDGFRVKNDIDRLGLDLEFRLDLRLTNTLDDPLLNGAVDVIDGTLSFQGERFTVRSGALRFDGDPRAPYFDILADADVQIRCRETDLIDAASEVGFIGAFDTEDQTVHRVTLTVQGPPSQLDIKLESNPYLDQRDILSVLLTRCTVDQLTASSAGSPTLEVALGPVLGWIEGYVQDAVQIQEFTITPGVDGVNTSFGDSLLVNELTWRLQLNTALAETGGAFQGTLKYKLSDPLSAELRATQLYESDVNLLDLKLRYRLLLD